MIDITYLRDRPDELEASLKRRGVTINVAGLVALDAERRAARTNAEQLRAEQKESGKSIAKLSGEEKTAAIAAAGQLAEDYKRRLSEVDALDQEFNDIWLTLPNMTDSSAADGFTEDDAVEISRYGDQPDFGFEVLDHVDLGVSLDVVDIERAVKVSGSRFGLKKGKLAVLEMALMRFAVDNLSEHGFTPVMPPVLVREQALFGTGFFPGDREQVYSVQEDDLYLVGTSEVPLAAMHGEEIFDGPDLPMRYVGVSTCFRVEAGTYGKDTRGLFRVHQFDKAEMFSFVHPDASTEEHELLLAREEELVRALELPYRVVNVAAGDLGSSAAKKYDIEAWFPGQGRYREITSTSNTTDFQSRRLKIRFKDDQGKNQLVHTLNGTAVTPRHLIALMENHQDAEGSIRIPEALVPYTGFSSIDPA
ncbi:MAG: serine--tRNA ligase [Acidimicrobiia bacterium]